MVYVLTNIEAEATHKVLKRLGPSAGQDLPDGERRTLRDLIEKLGNEIENGLPEEPDTPDNELPEGPDTPDNELPTSPPTAGNELPEEPDTPDQSLPGASGRPDNTVPGATPKY